MDSASKIGPIRQGIGAAKANLIPGIILQLFALGIIAAYYLIPFVREILEKLAVFRDKWGFFFSVPSTALFGGILPTFFLHLQKGPVELHPWRHMPFYAIFWGIKGAEVDALYRAQNLIFGSDPHLTTILCKVAIDQLIYAALWAVPSTAIAYRWKNTGYKIRTMGEILDKHWYRDRIWPLLLTNWCVWIPSVAIIYCVKLPLQLPLQNIILCFWSLLVVFITGRKGKKM